jgi:Na+/H+ antiporter NhaD/arsenite permease-like protein
MHPWIPLLIIFGIVYALIASEKVDKTIAAGLGAAAAIMLHYVPYEKALEHVDLNVIFLLVGMMVIVNVLATTGLFQWVAVVIARKARGNGPVIVVSLLLATAFVSAFLDNVTTVILIAPITILICQVLEIQAIPVLIMEAVFSNIGGTATLVGDPPNILIGSSAGPLVNGLHPGLSFNEFLVNLTPVILLIMAVSVVAVFLVFGKGLKVKEAAKARIMATEPGLAIIDRKRMYIGLAVFCLILLGFFLGRVLRIEPGIVALAGALLMVLACRADLHHCLGKVEWNTILFFISLFMLIGSLQEAGLFDFLGQQVVGLTRGNLMLTTLVILWVSAIASAVIDNIPLVIAMIPLINSIIPAFAKQMGYADGSPMITTHITYPLFWALALGACLGGNGTLIGASANVVICQIARKNRYPITFWQFTRLGMPMMILSLVISSAYMYLVYFLR